MLLVGTTSLADNSWAKLEDLPSNTYYWVTIITTNDNAKMGLTALGFDGGFYSRIYEKNTNSLTWISASNDYSYNEQIIGKFGYGSTVYRKTISCGGLPNATTKTV